MGMNSKPLLPRSVPAIMVLGSSEHPVSFPWCLLVLEALTLLVDGTLTGILSLCSILYLLETTTPGYKVWKSLEMSIL